MERPEYIRRLDFDKMQYEQLVSAGIAAVKGGDKQQARSLLFKATEMNPSDTRVWMWLSGTTADPVEQREYLESALAADPGNAAARRGLVLLSDEFDNSRLLEEGEGVQSSLKEETEEATSSTVFDCPNCGGRLTYMPEMGAQVCENCGYIEQPGTTTGTNPEATEQVLDFDLPTTVAHNWADEQQNLRCGQCGASSVLPAGETATECPFCGSYQLIKLVESEELVSPHLIAPAQFGEEEAITNVRNWLGRGWFIPDDLKKLAQPSRIRPAYYPFWTFDGTLHLNWSCEVSETSLDGRNWVTRNGTELLMFDDVLVPGLRKLDAKELARVGPFRLKELVDFEPGYLAGWKAVSYDLPLADASLKAREKVARKLHRDLHSRVLLGQEKRNLRSGGVSWSGITYKLVLLPLWLGSYRYQKNTYHVWINGQTGKVSGEKPIDPLKASAFWIAIVATLGFLIFIFWALAVTFGWFGY